MKPASVALASLLDSARTSLDSTLAFAECFTFSMPTGTVLTYTNADVPIFYKGNEFRCDGPLIQGLKYKSTIGFNVDRQNVTIAARPGDLISNAGAQFLVGLRDGAFEGCIIARDRVFFSDFVGGNLVGGIRMFLGRLSTVDQVGRTQAKISVATMLVHLDQQMPRNVYSPMCLNTLYDENCNLARSAFGTQGAAGSGSTAGVINFAGAIAQHAQGSLVFSTGANSGVRATVKAVSPGASLTLMYPLPEPPAVGDVFSVYWGCDHTMATCKSVFNNLSRFRGFPFIPPPQSAL